MRRQLMRIACSSSSGSENDMRVIEEEVGVLHLFFSIFPLEIHLIPRNCDVRV